MLMVRPAPERLSTVTTALAAQPGDFPNLSHAYQTRNRTPKGSARSLHQFGQQRGEQAATGAFDLGAPSKDLRHLAEHFCSFMLGRHFSDHLSIIRRGPEQLRFERDNGERLAFQSLCEICRRNFWPFWYAYLI